MACKGLIVPNFVSAEALEVILKVPPPYKLCNKHYQIMYQQSVTPVPCASCGVKPLHGTAFTRHSPNAEMVCRHFFETTGFELNLTHADYICSTCYKLHLTVLDNKGLHTPNQSLTEIITSLKGKLSNIDGDRLASCIEQVVVYVAQSLQHDRALLLSDVSRMFLESYGFELDGGAITDALYELEGLEGTVKFSSRWLLQQLILQLHEHMSYRCVHKKFGTILYNKRGDLLKSLSWALGSKGSTSSSVSAFSFNSHCNESELLDDAGKLVNTLMHKEIERASQAFTSNKFNPSSFKLKESVEAINPMLWNFLCTITKSVREYSGKAVPPNKQIMRYFVLCQLMHCTNQQFLSPLHYILADTIEMYGGARKLIKLFNRLGIVCSTDTHDRVVMEIAENERSKQISESLIPNVFTVTSVDNIDILKPHAAVYCGDQGRSYHGTTIQVVQPHPLLVLSSNANTANTSICTCTHNICTCIHNICTCTYSNSSISDLHVATAATADSMVPTESATINTCSHTLEPAQLCMLTDNMSDNNESHVATVAIFDSDLPESAALNHHPFSAQQSTSLMQPCSRSKSPLPKKRTVSIKQPFNTRSTHLQVTTPVMHQSLSIVALDGFKENEKESSERKKIEYQYLCYMHCKEALKGVANEKILKALHQFTVEQTRVPPSNIYYMEVIDENPDSTETMKLVSEMLLDVPALNLGGYTVVVGDGKTYTHLQKVKSLYSKEMNGLLIYPGDWHLLKNYQKVLMKIYYSAGLKELAEAAGFKGATLTALQNCSNFKHTHHFLVQTWESMYRVILLEFLKRKPTILNDILAIVNESDLRNDTPIILIEHIEEYLEHKQYDTCSFLTYIEEHAVLDDTWRFWARFVLEDCLAYVNLFIAIRQKNWHLRIAAIKLMAPLFAAFDRTCYERLIPAHLADIQTYPKDIIHSFENGGFAVSINGNPGHSVALDEAHEMCVNKDLKMAITQPMQAYLQKMSMYLRYRVAQHKNLMDKLFSQNREDNTKPSFYEKESQVNKKCSFNVQSNLTLSSLASTKQLS